jgi:antirestriction protein ArdC
MIYRKAEQEQPSADEREVSALRGFKVVHVFDVSQTEGEELPRFAAVSGTPGEYLARLEQLVRSRGIVVDYGFIAGGSLGISRDGSIEIRPDLPAGETFAVLVHEFAHELLHKSERRKDTTRTIRETEAEAVAHVVCQAFGIDCTTRSADYIQLYQGDEQTLLQSLDHIQKTAAEIIDALQEEDVELEPTKQQMETLSA